MMNRHIIMACSLALALCLPTGVLLADSDVLMPGRQPTEQVVTNGLNRLGLSVRLGYNIDARFRAAGSSVLHPLGIKTPHGNNYNYDDGYVLTDGSGSQHGQTWYFGYNDPLTQINGVTDTTVTLHRTTATGNQPAGSTGVDSDDLSLGLELTYSRELGRKGKLQYGVEAAVNYLNVFFHNSSVTTESLTRTTDVYQGAPGTHIPIRTPYQGPFAGPDFVISNTPFSSSTASLGSGTLKNQHEFNADIWGFRLGPYLEYPLVTNFDLSISGGLAVGLVDDTASWSQRITLPGQVLGASGGGDRFDILWGYYLRANLAWQFTDNWFLSGGVQYQDIGQIHHQYGTQTLDLDLSKSLFFTGGIAYRF